VSQGPIGFFTQPFEEYTILWIIISLGLGGLLTEAGKFFFEKALPSLQQKKTARSAFRKYSYPLLASASLLSLDLRDFLNYLEKDQNWFGKGKDNDTDPHVKHKRLSILYHFGKFYSWCRIFKKEAFIEHSATIEKRKSKYFPSIKEPVDLNKYE